MPYFHPVKPCRCGSELPRYDLTDAAGIFCCYVCDECESVKRAFYRSVIFEAGSRYAMTGDEEQLEMDYDN